MTSPGSLRNFVASFMATVDNTVVVLSDYDTGVVFASGTGNITNFTTANTETTVVVHDTAHGAREGDFVTISGVSGTVNGIIAANLEGERIFCAYFICNNVGSSREGHVGCNGGADDEFNIKRISTCLFQ